jgi:hypothetical protein
MRISRLSALAVMATLALAPVANAMPIDPQPDSPGSAIQQDRSHPRAGGTVAPDSAAKPKVFWSYSYQQEGKATPVHHSVPAAGDSAPTAAVVISLVLIALVAGSVAFAVRSRRRSVGLAV